MPEVLSPESKPPATKTADDINDLFKTLDQEEVKEIPVKKESKKEETSEEESEEEEIDEEDIKLKEPEEEEEKLDLDSEIEIDAPPKKREILKKYPDIFKDFPFMEKVLYRDKQYNELFGSFDDAKEVAERVEIFNDFESDLASGNTESILKGVKESDSKAFNRIVDNYLPTLARVDKDAYFHVIGNLNRRLVQEMAQEAENSKNDDLLQAAVLVNQFLFGTSKWTAPSKLVNEDSPESNEVEKERASLIQERFETVRDELQTQIDNTLKATISEYIDPKGQMSAYVKKNAVADAMRILTDSLASDESVTKNLNKLWRVAGESKFSKDDIGKIKSFYLGRGRSGLKNAILKARAEALKESSPKAKKEVEEESSEDSPKRRQIPSGRPSQSVKKNEMKKGESVADFFARD